MQRTFSFTKHQQLIENPKLTILLYEFTFLEPPTADAESGCDARNDVVADDAIDDVEPGSDSIDR
jgi:hypothetical protein